VLASDHLVSIKKDNCLVIRKDLKEIRTLRECVKSEAFKKIREEEKHCWSRAPGLHKKDDRLVIRKDLKETGTLRKCVKSEALKKIRVEKEQR